MEPSAGHGAGAGEWSVHDAEQDADAWYAAQDVGGGGGWYDEQGQYVDANGEYAYAYPYEGEGHGEEGWGLAESSYYPEGGAAVEQYVYDDGQAAWAEEAGEGGAGDWTVQDVAADGGEVSEGLDAEGAAAAGGAVTADGAAPAGRTGQGQRGAGEWRAPWAVRWKRRNCVPWHCSVCSKENKYKAEQCVQCGKAAPVGANLRIEDAAATLIQNMCRRAASRQTLRLACLQRYVRRFDVKTGAVFYEDKASGARLERKPALVREGDQIAMDPAEEAQYREYLAGLEAKERLRKAFAERESQRDKDRAAARDKAEQAAKHEWETKWHAPLVGAERNGELIANWQGFCAADLHPRLWELAPELKLVRLIGNPLGYLDGSLCAGFCNVTVLSLSNCGLAQLPAEFTSMTALEDLNLMRNALTALPEDFGRLAKLTSLHLACNQLKTLPASFKELRELPRLNLEQNPITKLPESIVELNCRILSWSKMQLRQLPRTIASFGLTLVSLTADHNRLRRVPKGVGKLRALKHLSLCDNLLHSIPDEVCELRALERLWLDWNQIKELPPDFLGLTSLQSLHLEGNPMQTPETEVIVKGVPAVQQWFRDSVAFYTAKERKTLVLELQSMLATLLEEDLHEDGFYYAGATTGAIGEKRDLYHALAPGYLFSHVVPTWNKFVEDLAEADGGDLAEERLQQWSEERRKAEQLDQQAYTRLENLVLNQMESFSNDIAAGESSEMEGLSQSIDGSLDAQSEAAAVEARKQEEAKHRQMLAELESMQQIEGDDDHAARRKRVAHEVKKVRRFLKPFKFTEEEVDDALAHYADNYGPVAADKETARFHRCECRRGGERRLCVPPDETFRCERHDVLLVKFASVTYMDKLRRDSLNAEEQTLAERCQEVEATDREYAASEEGVEFFSGVAMIKAAEILEEEKIQAHIFRYRVRLETKRRKQRRKRQAAKERLTKSMEARARALQAKRAEAVGLLERSKGWEAKEVQNKIMALDDELENPPQEVEIEILEQEEETAQEKHAMLTSRDQALKSFVPPYGIVSEVRERLFKPLARKAEEVHLKLVEAYIESHKKEVILEVRREYRITRRIMFNWMNLGVKSTFAAWKGFVRSQLFWKRKIAREEASQKALADADGQVRDLYKRAEHAKWVGLVDRFSDRPYWQHSETGEITWEEPRVEDCEYVPRVGVHKVKYPLKVLPDALEEETRLQDEALALAADQMLHASAATAGAGPEQDDGLQHVDYTEYDYQGGGAADGYGVAIPVG